MPSIWPWDGLGMALGWLEGGLGWLCASIGGGLPPVCRKPRLYHGARRRLRDGVGGVLAGERVLQLGGEDGQAVQKDAVVNALLGVFGELPLAHHLEDVALVELLQVRVQAAGGLEIAEVEMVAALVEPLA